MWSVSPKAADSVHDSGGCTYDQTTRVKAAPPKTLLLHRDPASSPPTQFLHFSSFTGSFRAPRAPPRSLSLEGWRGGGSEKEGLGRWRGSLLTSVSTWRVRTGLSVSGPASARHTAPLSRSSSNSRSGQRKGRRDMTRPGWDTGAPGQAERVQATRTPQLQARLVWAGRKKRAPPPPACPHLLEGRSQHSQPCDPRWRILTHLLVFPSHDEGHVIAPICHFNTHCKGGVRL